MPTVQKDWDIPQFSQSVFISCVMFFYFLASVFTGKISDQLGRQLPIQATVSLLFLFNFLSTFATSYHEYFLLRMINGFFHGVNDNLIVTLATEVSTKDYRALGTSMIYITWGAGQLLSVHSTRFFFSEIDEGDWRTMIRVQAFCFFLPLVYCVKNLLESPRFLVSSGRLPQAVKLLNHYGQENNLSAYQPLNNQDIASLQKWSNDTRLDKHNESKSNILSLFKGSIRKKTLALITVRVSLSFLQQILMMFFPLIISGGDEDGQTQKKRTLFEQNMILSIFPVSQIVGGFFANKVADSASLGRKTTLILFCTLNALISFYLSEFSGFFILLVFLLGINQQIITICTSIITVEIYNTQLRATASGIIRAMSRFATITMPYMTFALMELGPTKPFILLTPVFLLAAYLVKSHLHETRGINLDTEIEE